MLALRSPAIRGYRAPRLPQLSGKNAASCTTCRVVLPRPKTFPIIGAGGWRRTYHALTGSGPEGSSPNDFELVVRQSPFIRSRADRLALRAWLALRGGGLTAGRACGLVLRTETIRIGGSWPKRNPAMATRQARARKHRQTLRRFGAQIPAADVRRLDRPGRPRHDFEERLRFGAHRARLYAHRRARRRQDDDGPHPRPRPQL